MNRNRYGRHQKDQVDRDAERRKGTDWVTDFVLGLSVFNEVREHDQMVSHNQDDDLVEKL